MGNKKITTNLKQTNKKNDSIQILRGLSIIAVVIIHTYPHSLFGVYLRPFVNYAVAMFIFLSGYLTKVDITDYKRFVFKRIKRVLVPYCLWSVIYMIPSGFDGFWIKFLTGRCCSIYYYIFAYMQFVVLTPLIVKLIKSKYRIIGWFITPVFTILFRYIFTWMGLHVASDNFCYLFVAWFIYYFVGILLGNNLMTLKRNTVRSVILYVFFIGLSIGEGLLWYKVGNYDMATTQLRLTSIATSLLMIVFAYHFIRSNGHLGFLSKPMVVVGNTSFGIYLSHIAIKGRLFLIPMWESVIFPINSLVVLIVSVICVLIGQKILSKFSWILGL